MFRSKRTFHETAVPQTHTLLLSGYQMALGWPMLLLGLSPGGQDDEHMQRHSGFTRMGKACSGSGNSCSFPERTCRWISQSLFQDACQWESLRNCAAHAPSPSLYYVSQTSVGMHQESMGRKTHGGTSTYGRVIIHIVDVCCIWNSLAGGGATIMVLCISWAGLLWVFRKSNSATAEKLPKRVRRMKQAILCVCVCVTLSACVKNSKSNIFTLLTF